MSAENIIGGKNLCKKEFVFWNSKLIIIDRVNNLASFYELLV